MAAVMLSCLAGCAQKEGPLGTAGKEVTVSVSAAIDGGAATRAYGDATELSTANRAILEVYLKDDKGNLQKYGDDNRYYVGVSGDRASFPELRLVSGHDYLFVLWADCVDDPGTEEGLKTDKYYNTADFAALTYSDLKLPGNSDEVDAFYSAFTENISESKRITAKLVRPFGQLNIYAKDYDDIPLESLKPGKVSVMSLDMPSGLNLLTGETLEVKSKSFSKMDIAENSTLDGTKGRRLSFNYVFTMAGNATEHLLGDFYMTFWDAAGSSKVAAQYDFSANIPIQRNYRTNVIGNLLTDGVILDIELNPVFGGEVTCGSEEQIRTALEKGDDVALVQDVVLTGGPLEVEAGKDVTVNLNGHKVTNTDDLWNDVGKDWSLFSVRGGTLTITGEGDMSAKENDCYAVDVREGGTVNIEGGEFLGNVHCIYVYEGTANISGGTFGIQQLASAEDGYCQLLNCHNTKFAEGKARINVTGGTFINYNPADGDDNAPEDSFLVEGYNSLKISDEPAPNGTYEVVSDKAIEEMFNAGGSVELKSDIKFADTPYIENTTLSLTLADGAEVDVADGMDQTFMVSKSATMSINGNGTIYGSDNCPTKNSAVIYAGGNLTIGGNEGDDLKFEGGSGGKTNAVVRVQSGTTVIKSGYFHARLDKDGKANSCIYACPSRGRTSRIEIYGGVFETDKDVNGWYPVLNIQDDCRSRTTILVYGGIFVNYDPAIGDNSGAEGDTFVAPGYESVETTYEGKPAWEVRLKQGN